MDSNVIQLNAFKERTKPMVAIWDRKRIFLRMLDDARVKSRTEIVRERFLSVIWMWAKADKSESCFDNNPVIFWMSDNEFAILRGIIDWDCDLSWYEKLSEEDQINFINKCTLIIDVIDEKLNLVGNAYIWYCRRKIENYRANNFGDESKPLRI